MRLLCRVCFLRKALPGFKTYHTSSSLCKIVQFNLSDIGEGIREVTVRDWFVKVGDRVSQFENVCLVESDKASVSITSRFDGTVKKLYYEIGDTALVGKPLVDIDVPDEGPDVTPGPGEVKQRESEPSLPQHKPLQNENKERVNENVDHFVNPQCETGLPINRALATPAVRRIAKENNVDLNSVKATGKGGRVLKEDILKHLDELTTESTVKVQLPLDRKVEITGIMRAMVKTMMKSNTIPTFGYCDEIDMSALIELRKNMKGYAAKKGTNITYMPFYIKAMSKALEEFPELNATVDETCENITYKSQHNIGIAMDTEKGLIVPNIKNVQSLSVLEIGIYLNELIEKGRKLQLSPSDMSGGSITISNIGIIGGTYLRPLIFPPEVCILALGKTRLVPQFDEKGELVKKHILNASWAADHRVVDGATLAKFSNTLKEYIENPNYLLMNL